MSALNSMLRAVIFDLDGVITDTAEYHFQAWKRLAEEEGIPFTRADNEKLRGVSRRESLRLLLGNRQISEDQAQEWMARKNSYYREMITSLTPADQLPGVTSLLSELRIAGFKLAIASASRNAPDVITRLGIEDQIDVCADGSSIERQKPAPDLFLHTAHLLGVPPSSCLVVEDAASGIQAAQAAGMLAVGIGPNERVGQAQWVLPGLDGVRAWDLIKVSTWRVGETFFDPRVQHAHETIFTQGNGYLGTRGTLEEGFPNDHPATFVHGMWDDVPISFTELANAPDWTALDIRINGQRFSLADGTIEHYARFLDLRTGVLFRRVRWSPPEGERSCDLIFERFPCLSDPHVCVVRVRVEPIHDHATVEVRAVLDGHVNNQGRLHWNIVSQDMEPNRASLLVETCNTRKSLAMSTELMVSGSEAQIYDRDYQNAPGVVAQAEVEPGGELVVDKFVAVFTSRDVEKPLQAARSKVTETASDGFNSLHRVNAASWKEFWDGSDVIIEGDDEAQLAIRHALFQLRIAASTSDEHVSIGAKTLSGFGYKGHVFWDTEIFALPFFTYTQPALARNLLMYRWHTIEGARRKAAESGFAGAQFAWESAETGDEVTPRWVPDAGDSTRMVRIWPGEIQLHNTADIAYAIWQYFRVTGDEEFMCTIGAPIILETALFWGERVERENGRYAIRQVIGPDEYHHHVDNNAFTNGMVRWHLQRALDVRQWLHEITPREARALDLRLGLTPEALECWEDIIANLFFPHDPQTGLIEQFEGFFQLPDVDWGQYKDRTQSMQTLLGIDGANEHQVLKQPDVIMLLCLLCDEFDHKTWQSNWEYYSPRTDHSYGSSLGPSIHAWAACELGLPEVGYEHFMRAARMDLEDNRGNTADGIHAASAGGLWQAIVFGFAGLHLSENGYKLRANLPSHWKRLAFRFRFRGEWQDVELCAGSK
jgi:beta-phosphoglucomutase